MTEAIQRSKKNIIVKGTKSVLRATSHEKSETFQPKTEFTNISRRVLPKYIKANILVKDGKEPHEIDIVTFFDLIYRIVEEEGPIHEEEIARRIASACGLERTGSRIVERVQLALRLDSEKPSPRLLRDDGFCFTKSQLEDTPVRDRSLESSTISKAYNISLIEIKECIKLVIHDSCGGSDQDIIRETARLFGFKRVGDELQERINNGLKELRKQDRSF